MWFLTIDIGQVREVEEKFSLLKVQSTIDAAQDVVQVLAKKKAQRPKEQCIMIKKSVVLKLW